MSRVGRKGGEPRDRFGHTFLTGVHGGCIVPRGHRLWVAAPQKNRPRAAHRPVGGPPGTSIRVVVVMSAGADAPSARRQVLAGEGTALVEERRSRFHAYAAPVGDEDGPPLRDWLLSVRARHREARHVVFAWRGAGDRSRGTDDGEPAGTGARPCLDALQRLDLRGAAVAVARIYGGTPLGAANLARVYGRAAQAAVAAAAPRAQCAGRRLEAWVPFVGADRAERLLRAAGAADLRLLPAHGGLALQAWLPEEGVPGVRTALNAIAAGAARCRWGDALEWR